MTVKITWKSIALGTSETVVSRARTGQCARGFTLVELIFVLFLLSTFALVSTKLLVATLKIPHEAGLKRDAVVRFESVMSALRRDVWSAARLSTVDDHTLLVESAAGTKTTWSIGNEQVIRTPSEGAPHRWGLQQQLRFTANGLTLTIAVIDDPTHRDRIEMISQMMLARREVGK